jgi:hypothetical protein
MLICCNNHSNIIATVDYSFTGCFGSENSKLLIYKTDNAIMAKLETKGFHRTYKRKINALQIDTLNIFIQKLRNLDEEGLCTTQEYYKVFIGNEIISKTDGNCDWNGFTKLKECLFNHY